jgi:hypothetical protein
MKYLNVDLPIIQSKFSLKYLNMPSSLFEVFNDRNYNAYIDMDVQTLNNEQLVNSNYAKNAS